MKNKIVILFGGKSAEHDVSVDSANAIIDNIDNDKYEIILCGITKCGSWLTYKESLAMLNKQKYNTVSKINPFDILESGDVIFPIIHGTQGEDGVIQGVLELANKPYIGCNVLSSALCMDKLIAKKLLSNIIQVKYLAASVDSDLDQIEQALGFPCFVKPASLGSSIGISKVANKTELSLALQLANQYDSKIIVEEFIEGREIEVAVLGNENPTASVPGEIISNAKFYDYEAKYCDDSLVLKIPAELHSEKIDQIKRIALEVYKQMDCSGLARVDFFVKDNDIYLNEINTMPGFTQVSMYPKLWDYSGVPFKELITKSINFANEKHNQKKCHSYSPT